MIHPSSIIAESAKIGKNVQIGPFCVIGDNVDIGDNCVLTSHVVIKGHSKIGINNVFFQFCSIGEDCQDKKYAGETTYLEIGDNNVFRESCTIHRGTTQDKGLTQIGSGNLFMVNTHVAHDCILGDDNIFANNCTLAGHVHVGNQVILGGMTAVHQFCHIGSHSFTGGGAIVLKDIPPYVMVSGIKHIPQGINSEGLKRRGFTSSAIMAIKRAYKVIYRNGNTTDQALPLLNEMAESESDVKILADFVASSKRGIIR
ncbi:acyl-ACP--UDP-N-acetylglucosamine O-acyltransferase [Brumicola nitratireducens]|jgi:UDP-N-acetylglucosamine acyltransferase|uniref:Acyl-[acyl-carrier-protein]--UDP-N-acetylglucosamine O-acyltransferase n=1 Tax=Glaciecola nitratireducens (strain JCM 12485 / KCTC 12276 / FR1064) TaxID=1085623 RepID=G4QI10_GLANF|nr:acyl-ACP--UDP-N-acetylglucosamine O-acyltransferase [Glaciecola nitratireducens]AEP30543.1 acyl-(acyl-carrier-protein)--UDP-N-acetylglucosamine O-acyltransferase [Glaciecola nitratireducens FR1064]